MKKTIRHLLDHKGSDIYSIAPTASVYEAIASMAEKGIGALLVMDGDRLVGILSERDYARRVILEGRSSQTTRVEEIMTPKVICALPERSVEEAMALMTEHRVRHIPVIDENSKVVGVISIGDVVRAVIDVQRFHIEQLEAYISTG